MSETAVRNRCCVYVEVRGMRSFASNQCQRKSVVVVDGKHYCHQHDPRAVAEREKKSFSKHRRAADSDFRALQCAEALVGIPSPAEFVEAARLLANETRFMLQKSKNIELAAWEVKVQNAVAIVLNEPRKDATRN